MGTQVQLLAWCTVSRITGLPFGKNSCFFSLEKMLPPPRHPDTQPWHPPRAVSTSNCGRRQQRGCCPHWGLQDGTQGLCPPALTQEHPSRCHMCQSPHPPCEGAVGLGRGTAGPLGLLCASPRASGCHSCQPLQPWHLQGDSNCPFFRLD